MVNRLKKQKMQVSQALKKLNSIYKLNYTLVDVAHELGLQYGESLSRINTDTKFSFVYDICKVFYKFYPDYPKYQWGFIEFCELLFDESL